MNAHELAARATKADALLAVLDLLTPPPSAADLASWHAESWALAAGVARVRPPSAATIAVIVDRVLAREALHGALLSSCCSERIVTCDCAECDGRGSVQVGTDHWRDTETARCGACGGSGVGGRVCLRCDGAVRS